MSIRAEDAPLRPTLDGDALGRALRGGLDLPLSALRASLEALAVDLSGDPRSAGVANALKEVGKAGRAVRDLVEYATSPVPRPLECTVEEIVQGARAPLHEDDRRRLIVARFERGRRLLVDAPLLARALQRLFENAVEATSGVVLVSVHHRPGQVRFVVINPDPHVVLDPDWAAAPFHTDKPRHLGLGLALAKRDLEAQGGELAIERTPRGETVVTARVPDRAPPAQEARR